MDGFLPSLRFLVTLQNGSTFSGFYSPSPGNMAFPISLKSNLFTLCTSWASGLSARTANISQCENGQHSTSFTDAHTHSFTLIHSCMHSCIHALTRSTDICKASAQCPHIFNAHGQKGHRMTLSDHYFPSYPQSLHISQSQNMVQIFLSRMFRYDHFNISFSSRKAGELL